MDAIWPDAAVTDDSLVQCLVEIRRALGDDQAWVHTARGRGYRFDGAVRPIVGSGEAAAAASTDGGAVPAPMPVTDSSVLAAPPRTQARAWGVAIAVVAMVSLSAAGWAVWGRSTTPAPRTAEAARAFAEGLRSADRPNRESLAAAVAAYERAIALDPSFAPAHAALANTLVVRGVFGGARPDESYPRARAEALRAIELDPTLAEGHVALGHVRVQWDRDWRGAEESYRRALALDPNAPRAHVLYALYPRRDGPRRRGPARKPDRADASTRLAHDRRDQGGHAAGGPASRGGHRAGPARDPPRSKLQPRPLLAGAGVGGGRPVRRGDDGSAGVAHGGGEPARRRRRLHSRPRRPARGGARGAPGARGRTRPINLRARLPTLPSSPRAWAIAKRR